MKTGVYVKEFTRNKQKFDKLLKSLDYKHLHEFENELGFRLCFGEGHKHRDFELSTIFIVYNKLKKRWGDIYYSIPKEEVASFLKRCPFLTLEKVVESLGYNIKSYTEYNRQTKKEDK